ncbi:hypothetical protein DITRI_Ditri20bG0087800 [Diplodiscus trichospermus]
MEMEFGRKGNSIEETISCWIISGLILNGEFDASKTFASMIHKEIETNDMNAVLWTSTISSRDLHGQVEFLANEGIMPNEDVVEKQGEMLNGFHSEKLATVYGFISTTSQTPIRIRKKNLEFAVTVINLCEIYLSASR